jgi:hypothetical protein
MTLDELLLEWSYRSERGYPSMDNPSDVLLLKEILTELKIPESDIINIVELRLPESEIEEVVDSFEEDEPGGDDLTVPGTDGMDADSPVEKEKEKQAQKRKKTQQTTPTPSDNNEISSLRTQLGSHSKSDLLKLIKDAELTSDQIQKLHKSVGSFAYKDDILRVVNQKGFTSDKFKTGNTAIDTIFEKIAESEIDEFIKYIEKPKKLSDVAVGGNFASQMGISNKLAKDLINIEPGADAGGSSVGKAEVFLGLMFTDVDNNVKSGDLNWGGKNLEVKGTGGRLGQQAGRGSDSKIQIETLAKDFLSEEELMEYIERLQKIKYSMVISIKELFEKTDGGSDVIARFQTTLDNTFYNKGVAKDYFKDSSDFTNLDKVKKNLIKLNARSYAIKTNVDVFLFLNSSNGDYVIIDIDGLDQAIDDVKFDTSVRGVTGYKWYDIAPNMVVREGDIQVGKHIEEIL